jgi:LmbE family N-acetylglucosaminyl deacetylase
MEPSALFLFAHPDDEFGIYHCLDQERRRGRRIRCAYLTDGGAGVASPDRRIAESLAVLRSYGVRPQDVAFPGRELSIPDGGLPEHLAKVGDWIGKHLAQHDTPAAVYLPAWEGGHHDHDGLHAVALTVLQRCGLIDRVHQFPLYHGQGCKEPWFKVLAPLAANGETRTLPIPWHSRLRYVFHCMRYPSQWRSWIGLFPFVAWHYLARGTQCLQAVSPARTGSRPHEGPLYYEQRKFYTWERMQEQLARYGANDAPP